MSKSVSIHPLIDAGLRPGKAGFADGTLTYDCLNPPLMDALASFAAAKAKGTHA
jgi:hypothetical protein